MQVKVPNYDASPRQAKFHLSGSFETLYGGAAGGGKTAALVAEAVTTCLEYPGIAVYIFRKTIPELKKTILPEIRKQCADYINAGKLVWHGTDRQFMFDNNSTITLAYCQNPGDEYNYQGAEIQLLMFDELTHFMQDQYEYLKTRVRTTEEFPLRVMSATNPGNIGHGWVKSYFIDPAQPEQEHTDRETGETRVFIPAKVIDHPSEKFRNDYSKRLQAIQDLSLRKALLDGDWDIFSGQVFTEWRRARHVVDPFQIPEHWRRWVGYDWGYGNNAFAAALWFAKDPGNNVTYIYREFYETGMITSDQALKMLAMSQGENISLWMGDPSIFKSRPNIESTETIADILQKEGMFFVPANNDRMMGLNAWHEHLAPGTDGTPKLKVFSNCFNLIRTLPTLPYDLHKVEDVDTDAEDH